MANNTRSGGRKGRGNRGREGRVWEGRKRGKGTWMCSSQMLSPGSAKAPSRLVI